MDGAAWLAEQPVTRRWGESRRRQAAATAIAAGQAAAARLAALPLPPIERLAGPHVFAGVRKYAEWDARRGVIVVYVRGVAELAAAQQVPPEQVEARLLAHERYHALVPHHATRAEEELAARACAAAWLA